VIEVKRETKKVFQGKEGFATLSAILVMAALVGCVLFFYHTSIVERAFFSPSLEGNKMGDSPVRKVTIALPPDYYLNPTKHYPVVYYLAGFGANNETDINWIGKENKYFFVKKTKLFLLSFIMTNFNLTRIVLFYCVNKTILILTLLKLVSTK